MFYIFQMSDRPALRPSVAVGEALRGVAHDILAEARADDQHVVRRANTEDVRGDAPMMGERELHGRHRRSSVPAPMPTG